MMPSWTQADGNLQPSEVMCTLGSHLNCEPGKVSGQGCAQEILLSDQIGLNELPFHFHGPSHYITQDKMASILSPELSSPKGRWADPIHQVDLEDSEEASTRCWPSGCSRQTQEAPSCPEFPEFSGQPCKLAQQLPHPALRGSFVLI